MLVLASEVLVEILCLAAGYPRRQGQTAAVFASDLCQRGPPSQSNVAHHLAPYCLQIYQLRLVLHWRISVCARAEGGRCWPPSEKHAPARLVGGPAR